MDFSTKLKCYRHMFNLTQATIADAMGVDRSTYSYYENGKLLPTSEGIQFLSRLFGISPATLLNKKPEEPIKQVPLRVLKDSGYEMMYSKEDNREIDMTFPELTQDEKEMILRYRIMKAAESQLTDSADPKADVIRKFLLEHYK